MKKGTAVGYGLLCAGFAIASSAHAGRQLTAEELKTMFTGKTVSAFNEKQGRLHKIYFAADGTSYFQEKSYTGKWWIDDAGRHCVESQHLTGCWPIFDNDGVYQKMDGDVITHTVKKIEDGDQR